MKLTRKNLHEALNQGAVSKKQLAVIGLPWPPQKGWLSALIGTEMADSKYAELASLKRPKKIPETSENKSDDARLRNMF